MDSFSNIKKTMGESDSFRYSQVIGGEVGSSIDDVLDSQIKQSPLPKLKAYYARVTPKDLDEQISIYKWRQQQKDHIIPIFSYHILSSNIFNPNPLIKVILPDYQSNFKAIPKLSFSQTLVLAKTIIRSLTILHEKFGCTYLKQKMIVLDEDNKIRVWPASDYYINPNNPFYYSSPNNTQKQSIKSLTKILKRKCLKSVLSEQFFIDIVRKNTFEQIYILIRKYEDKKKIIVPQTIIPSASSPNLHCVASSERILIKSTLNDSFSSKTLISRSLKNTFKVFLAEEKSQKQKKQNNNSDIEKIKRQEILPFKNSNMTRAHSGFISFTPEDKDYLNKNMKQLLKDSEIRHLNAQEQKQFNQEDSQMPLIEKSSNKLSLKSCVMSQIFNPQIKEAKQRKYRLNISAAEGKNRLHHEVLEADDEEVSPSIPKPPTPQVSQEDSLFRSQEIVAMNGWNNLFTLPLKTTKNMKQSYSYGADEESHLKGMKLKKLHTMGRIMTQSFLPVQEEDINEDY